tara:strand:- start:255 stop:440 length:186 start_codon:yes stop_codon:yes gene_type:complete
MNSLRPVIQQTMEAIVQIFMYQHLINKMKIKLLIKKFVPGKKINSKKVKRIENAERRQLKK